MVRLVLKGITSSIHLSLSGAFPFLDFNTPGALTTLTEIFDLGVHLAKDKDFLGYRPVISENPLKFGPFVWATYGQIQERRNNVGSALWSLFQSGALGGGELETVGIWSANRPGTYVALAIWISYPYVSLRMAGRRSCIACIQESWCQFV